ncbi:hypothetical protein [Pseudoxanthomonas sp. JBR18]|nr:hypothetical protein [Pseudoxanthomonas sp. JBR18]WCE05718.1 hypothetical protein PJ250_07170 [Pseudoxanthomonas sp. JBR18]
MPTPRTEPTPSDPGELPRLPPGAQERPAPIQAGDPPATDPDNPGQLH